MRRARRAALLVLLAACTACGSDRVFHCSQDDQCVLDGKAGRCEPSGYCSLPDAACPDGYRYVDQAPDALAGTCVTPGGCTEEPCDGCAVAVAAGAGHSCAVDRDGAVWCWGDNADLELGSDGGSSATPRVVTGVTGAVDVAAGDRYSCALLGDGGRVVCWGADDRGQLGTGQAGASALPGDRVDGSGSWHALTAGTAHSCAIDDDDTAWCWGDNTYEQVASGAGGSAASPEEPLGLLDCPIAIAAGGRHTAAVLDDGTVITWGEADAPALGRGSAAPSQPASIVVGAFEAASVASGAEHSCGVGIDRGVRCWGVASDGRLGVDGDRDQPAEVGLDADLVRAGGRHTCALDRGDLVCWGANDSGQLGSDGGSGTEPRPVTGAWLAVATGAAHTCAISTGGVVLCWGDNASGQLGHEGGSSSQPTAVPVPCD
jgi:alpha-tubulin suppressor-like RCC1 family protein